MPAISRSTRNWIFALILIPAAAYGVAKLAIWYTVKDGLSTVEESMAPFAKMGHSKILSPVFGAFGATGIRIKPHVFEEEITIGSVLVHINDPIEKYRFLSARMNDTIPTSFNFSLHGLRIPLSGNVAAWLDASTASGGASSGPGATCATGTGFQLVDMRRMGYDELVADVRADYAYDQRRGGLGTYLHVKFREMFEMTIESRIPAADVVFAVDRMRGPPRLSDLTVTLQDLSWSSRFNSYCADALGMTEAEYVTKRVNDTRQMLLSAGFEPSEELLSGLKKFAEGSASLTLSLNPVDPVDPTQLNMQGDPEYLIDQLGMEVMFEGTPVQELGRVAKLADEESEQPSQIDETYKPTPLAELPRYLKSSVRIFTADGKVHNGYLDSVDAQKIVLTQHLVGGSATFDVGRENVQKVLVLRP